MGYFYKKGEKKVRPGLYQRYENRGSSPTTGAMVGYCAITIQADWGPLNEVVTVGLSDSLTKLFGNGGTVADAQALFDGGATTVYVCRIGTGGTKAATDLNNGEGAALVHVEALYPGKREFAVSVKNVLGDSTKREFVVTEGATVLEKFTFVAGGNEAESLIAAAALSEYVKLTKQEGATGVLAAVQQQALTGGANPTVSTADYSAGFNVLETMDWNTISVDTDDNAVHALLATFMNRVYETGKFAMCVVGDPLTVALAERFNKARAFNDELVVYFGSGWIDSMGNKIDGHKAVNHVAGVIASTTSDKAITHLVIKGAADVAERLTNEQYIEAINSGCLMLSMSPEKQVWFDSGVNTLLSPDADQDEGWQKIKRVAVRNELMMRMDRTISKKVGRVINDADGQADVIQAGQAVLNEMVNECGKLLPGATFYLDAANPPQGDSAWFVIDADDADTMEKIYLLYRFRYSQLA